MQPIKAAAFASALVVCAGLVALRVRARQDSPIVTFTAGTCDQDGWVRGGAECLHIETARSPSVSASPSLVVVLHGDSPFGNPRYQYDMARRVAGENSNVIAVGMLRPGYTDPAGHRSSGVRGLTTGDNYNAEVIDAIADAIARLQRLHHPAATLIAGHSGGAAIAAGIMSRHPALAESALLVSCPCDVPRWRQHMQSIQNGAPIWSMPASFVSPHAVAEDVSPRARIAILVGEKDNVAPPALSREYYELLRGRGIDVRLQEIPNGDHEVFFDPMVSKTVTSLLARR